MRIAIGDEFLGAYSRLPRAQQRKVDEFLKKFRADPGSTGINLEPINAARDASLYSVRIDQAYRGVVHKADKGQTFILLWVDHHDDAYDWARRRKLTVHPETGCLQLIDMEALQKSLTTQPSPAAMPPLFRRLKEKHFLQLGVPVEYIPAVSAITDENELAALRGRIPGDAVDCLEMYAAGIELEDILRDLASGSEPAVDTSDIDAALEKDGSKRFFRVVENEQELEAMLAAPLEKWRVFLHPSQRKLVERDWDGPVRVLGGAGTGKTVVAMHRARWLAMHRFTAPGDRVLLTTFSKTLAADIRESLRSFTPGDVMERIEVTNLDDWAWSFLRGRGVTYGMAFRKETKELWQQAADLAPDGTDRAFLMEELDRVILPFGIESLYEYRASPREGRVTMLSGEQREAIWPVFDRYRALLLEKGLREPADAIRDARKILQSEPGTLPYRAVVVDEAQDMGLQDFMLVRALVPPADDDTNRIFVVGDTHQRIYGRKTALAHAGIDIGDRGRRLTVNYRTSEETRAWAERLLEGLQFDDLDGGADDQKGYRSLVHGPLPEVHTFASFDEEAGYIVSVLAPLLATPGGVAGACITARSGALVEKYEAALVARCQSPPDNAA